MKLKAGMIVDAFAVITTIINEQRVLPAKVAYRLARQHDKLEREANAVKAHHDALVRELGEETFHEVGEGDAMVRISTGHKVMDANMEQFTKQWAEIAAEEIDVDIVPLPLDMLGDNTAIHANEFKLLGPLVSE